MKLWAELLAGPLAWGISMAVSFAFAPWACAWNSKPVLFLLPIVALLVSAGCAALGWMEWRVVGREFPGEGGGAGVGSRTLASGIVLLNAGFFIVTLSQLIIPAVLGACE